MDLREHLQTTLGSAYRLERELGGGGMSRVFVAAETSLGRRVVVKVLPPDLAANVSTARFRKEIQLVASLQHPHIVSVLAAGEADGVLYYTMPFIEGVSLRERLRQSGELPTSEAVRILRDVTRALAYAHRHGVAHRDIKPENILLSEDGAMVVDFGIAKALSASTMDSATDASTGIGVALGTPAYMSPEQAAADPLIDQRSDIYSLGIVAYELLSGLPPFAGRTVNAVLAGHVLEVPEAIEKRRSSVPPRLASLVMRCLEKRPADRPQTAEAVLRELDGVALALGVESSGEGAGWRARWRSLVVAGVVVIAAIGGGWVYSHRQQSSSPSVHTIGVLPFANLSENVADESFSDGMAEELIGALGKIEGMRVRSASSLKGSQRDPSDIGKQLGVQSVVTGSVRRSGEQVRIAVRLVNVADGFQVWQDSYQREFRSTADVFRVQDDITRAIVNALQLKLVLAGRASAQPSRQTQHLDAYQAFLDGRYSLAKRTPEGIRTAIEHFTEAVRIDSSYALAWDGLAQANILLSNYWFVEPAEAFGRARQALDRALALDSSLAEGYTTLGFIELIHDWDWPAAERAFLRSIRLNANYPTSHHWYSLYLIAMGRGREALREVELALDLEPVSLIIRRELGRTYYYLGDNPRALAEYRQMLNLDPNFVSAHVWIARVHIAQGDYAAAIDELREQADYQGGHVSAVLAYAYARAGQRATATVILDELRARAKRQNVWPMFIAAVHLSLGQRDEALDLLEQEYTTRSAQMPYIRVDPLFAELHGDARFERLLQRMNFPP